MTTMPACGYNQTNSFILQYAIKRRSTQKYSRSEKNMLGGNIFGMICGSSLFYHLKKMVGSRAEKKKVCPDVYPALKVLSDAFLHNKGGTTRAFPSLTGVTRDVFYFQKCPVFKNK